MSELGEIVDKISYRSRTVAQRAEASALSIQNIGGALYQVDDQGNASLIIGGSASSITGLSGDVVATGPGVVTATIQAAAVTYAKIQNVAANSILGNITGSPAAVTEVSAANLRTFLALASIATSGSASDLVAGTVAIARLPTGGAPPRIATASAAGAASTVSLSDHTHAQDLCVYAPQLADLQGSGVLQQTYSAPNATPSKLTMASGNVPFGLSSGLLTQTTNLNYTGHLLRISDTNNDLHLSLAALASGDVSTGIRFEATGGVGGVFAQMRAQHDGTGSLGNRVGITVFSGSTNDSWGVGGQVTNESIFCYTQTADVFIGERSTIATGAGLGFVHLPAVNGTPTVAPSKAFGNRVATAIDTANTPKRLYAYVGGAWHYTAFDDGASGGITQLTGDGTAGPGTGSQAFTLAASGVTPGSYTNADITVDAKGRITVAANGAAGAAITQLTGDVTAGPGTGSQVATIAADAVTTTKIIDNAVTYAKMQTIADQRLVGNVSGGTAVPSSLTAAQVATFLGLSTTYQPIISATAGRVFYSGGGSVVSSSANFTFDGTNLNFPGTSAAQEVSQTGNQSLGIGTGSGNSTGSFYVFTNHTSRFAIDATGYADWVQTTTKASGASATLDVMDWNAATITITGNTNITTAGGFNLNVMRAPTYGSALAVTVTNAATFVVTGAPAAASNVTITNAYAIWTQGGTSVFDTITSNNGTNLLLKRGGTSVISISATQVLPATTNTFDFGASGTEWASVWSKLVKHNGSAMTVGTTSAHSLTLQYNSGSALVADATGTTLQGESTGATGGVLSVLAASKEIDVTGDVIPAADATYYLGKSGTVWAAVWTAGLARDNVNATLDLVDSTGLNINTFTTGNFQITHGSTDGRLITDATGIAFFQNPGGSPAGVAQQTVTGSRGGNAALASLLTKLALYGLIIDSSS